MFGIDYVLFVNVGKVVMMVVVLIVFVGYGIDVL